MKTIEERLRRLEQANRRWRAVAIILACALIAGAAYSQQPADVLRASRIEVGGEKGQKLTTIDGEGIKVVSPESRTIQAFITNDTIVVGKTEQFSAMSPGEVTVFSGKKAQAYLKSGEGPGLYVKNRQDKPVVFAGCTNKDQGIFLLFDANGEPIGELPPP